MAAVIIAYNGADYIEDAIVSVLTQTRPVDEVIVVDDGSTDATAEIARRHPGVRVISQSNQGASAARNRGVEEAECELIAFLDCDDMWLASKTELQAAILEAHPDVLAVSGGQIRLDERREMRRREVFPPPSRRGSVEALVSRNTVGNPSMVMVRRAAMLAVGGFDTAMSYGEDWDLWLRLAQVGAFAFVPDPVAIYRWHPDNTTHQTAAKQPRWNRSFQVRAAKLLPPLRRPLVHLRAMARYQLELAEHIHGFDGSRTERLARALLAVSLDPMRDGRRKLTMMFRAVRSKPVRPRSTLVPVAADADDVPTVSAVILTYNGEEFLQEALDSVMAQTRPPDEVLVLDNGSTDRSAEIARRYPGVRVVSLPRNIGAAGGYNRAAALATGRYLAFLDHDDVWLPRKLALQLAVVRQHPDTAVVSGRMVFWDVPSDTMRETGEWGSQGRSMPHSLVHHNHVGNLSVALVERRTFLAMGGMDPLQPWADDWDLWLRIAERHSIRFVDEPIVRYRWHASNTSNQNRRAAVASNEKVALSGMRRLLPRWQWPAARLRIRAWHELQLSHAAADQGNPFESLLRAALALALDPFADFRPKLGNMWRGLVRLGTVNA